jgi:glucan 1,3-beta-glucosidase
MVQTAFPGRTILLGEFGWPSAGRMREGALPSPVNEARTWHDVMALAKREGFRANFIEAYDQPWKRQLEGTVGGHWGLFDAYQRRPKFILGGRVSNHPRWRWQAAGGVGLAAIVFAAALAASRRREKLSSGDWITVAGIALFSGSLAGWTIANVPLESLTRGDWLRTLAWAALALLAPVAGAAAIGAGAAVPNFARVLARRAERRPPALELALGTLLMALTVLAVQAALGLVFDPRYRDFPFAPLTVATVPYLLLGMSATRPSGARGAAEIAAAAILVLSSAYVLIDEGFANWQSIWLCAVLGALALTLARVRGVQD